MKNILVNASASKTGGAETIIRTFVSNIPDDENNYIILSPINFKISEKRNILFIHKKTSGAKTIFFSLLGIMIYVIKYRPKKIISFNNINYIFSKSKGITYFHQPKALSSGYTDLKIIIYDICIYILLRKNIFVVQSDFIKELFISKYKINNNQVISCWPGFNIPIKKESIDFLTLKRNFSYVGILPIAYIADHKNIESLNELLPDLERNNVRIITLLNKNNSLLTTSDNFENIGCIEREILFDLYDKCDFLIFPSKDETVGLPIFEFLQTGKPAFVFTAGYSQSYYRQFKRPENFILYNCKRDFILKFEKLKDSFDNTINYSLGEWDKIFELL